MEYLQRNEKYREDKFLTKKIKGTQSDENIRGVCLMFSGHSLMMLYTVPSFIKIFLVVLKLQRRYDF